MVTSSLLMNQPPRSLPYKFLNHFFFFILFWALSLHQATKKKRRVLGPNLSFFGIQFFHGGQDQAGDFDCNNSSIT